MTTEIAILNKTAVALAADSAVTITGGLQNDAKIYNSANKLFALSKYQPVGIMIYESADLMDAPWETIIKVYRSKLKRQAFDKLEDYCHHFISFLENEFFSEENQQNYLKSLLSDYYEYLRDKITDDVNQKINESGSISDKDTKQLIKAHIEAEYKDWNAAQIVLSVNGITDFVNNFIKKYSEIVEDLIKSVFDKLPLIKSNKEKLFKISAYIFSKQILMRSSGVVIDGFGEREIYPSLFSFEMECVINNKLKYIKKGESSVEKQGASIIPFAQDDMIRTFVQGIDPELDEFSRDYIQEIFEMYSEMVASKMKALINSENAEEIVNDFKQQLQDVNRMIIDKYNQEMVKCKTDRYVYPILDTVQFLPKDELAAMAEALINLTSLKRKVSTVRETVGGPVDVAVISKGDGFIWIKRKHYFKPELNHQFFRNYFDYSEGKQANETESEA